MAQKLIIQKLSDELEIIVGPQLYALKGGFGGGDSDGPRIPRATGYNSFTYNDYGYDLYLEEYEFEFPGGDGSTTKLYRADSSVSANARSNCLGYALTGGDFMIIDNPQTSNDEGLIAKDSFEAKFGYVECSKSQATLVMVYDDIGAIHAGKYNPLFDTYDAKGGGAQFGIEYGMSEEDFLSPYNNMDVRYYKKVYPGSAY